MAGFTVFDVETPNRLSNRISAIGITVIEDGVITEEFYSLVNPETYFDQFNTQLTGISRETVRNAPTFPELWTKIEPLMSVGLLVAHNAVFDMNVLKKCLCDYDIKWIRQTATVVHVRKAEHGAVRGFSGAYDPEIRSGDSGGD